MTVENKKRQNFQAVAQSRLERVLESLDALGNCSKPSNYAYSKQELEPIFSAIHRKLLEVRQRLVMHSPHTGIPFRLSTPTTVELDGHEINRTQLAPADEVTSLLECDADFVALEPLRMRYAMQFGDELCWTIPASHGSHLGCVLLPVQEGILYLPYDQIDAERYEQFVLADTGLLAADTAKTLLDVATRRFGVSIHVLSDILAFHLVQEPTAQPSVNEECETRKVLQEQYRYLLTWGRPDERDHSINEINRALIQAVAKDHGCAYLGSLRNGPDLILYDGGTVDNFQYDFCMPQSDPELSELLARYYADERRPAALLTEILDHVQTYGGQLLNWV